MVLSGGLDLGLSLFPLWNTPHFKLTFQTLLDRGDLSLGNSVITLILGAGVHIIQKVLFECKSVNTNGVTKRFHEPLFFTWLGSVGLFATFVLQVQQILAKISTIRGFSSSFFLIGIGTFFNFFAGFLANYSSLYLNYSVSLMLRSSTLIFGCLISTFYLRRPLAFHQLCGVGIVVTAIIIVGIAAMFGESTTTHMPATTFEIFLWILGRIFSKGFQAIAMLIEERVLKSTDISPVDLSGISGLWSMTLASLCLFFSNFADTWRMLVNNHMIQFLSFASILFFALWNIMCLYVTHKASAIVRMLLDQLTIVAVWIVQLVICWIGFPKQGEAWNSWSWLQLLGYFVMVIGVCIYQKVIRVDAVTDDEFISPLADPLSE